VYNLHDSLEASLSLPVRGSSKAPPLTDVIGVRLGHLEPVGPAPVRRHHRATTGAPTTVVAGDELIGGQRDYDG
jgi:hypothetical protein